MNHDGIFGSPGQALPATAIQDRVFRKIAFRLLPLLVVCYFAAFLDRVNVGFAALTMREDIGLSATAYGLGSGIFFLSYFIFEVPSNLLLARFGARRWIARIMITWGVISACTALVQGSTSFLVMRFLLGAAEAGFYPGILYYLSTWFPDRKRAGIIALLLLSNPFATIIGAPVSGLILSTGAHSGLQAWQWLFLLESIPSLVLGVLVFRLLPEKVEEVNWLSAPEKAVAREVMDADMAGRVSKGKTAIRLSQIFHHPYILGLALVFLGIAMTNSTINFWLPQIIHHAGFSIMATGFISMIPYVAAVIALLWWGRRSDRKNERFFHMMAPLLVAIIGVTITAVSGAPLSQIAGLTLASAGLFALLPVFWSLPAQFLVGASAAGGIAVINSIGNLGGFFGPSAMGFIKDLTGSFSLGLLVNITMLSISLVTVVIFATRTRLGNRQDGR